MSDYMRDRLKPYQRTVGGIMGAFAGVGVGGLLSLLVPTDSWLVFGVLMGVSAGAGVVLGLCFPAIADWLFWLLQLLS